MAILLFLLAVADVHGRDEPALMPRHLLVDLLEGLGRDWGAWSGHTGHDKVNAAMSAVGIKELHSTHGSCDAHSVQCAIALRFVYLFNCYRSDDSGCNDCRLDSDRARNMLLHRVQCPICAGGAADSCIGGLEDLAALSMFDYCHNLVMMDCPRVLGATPINNS